MLRRPCILICVSLALSLAACAPPTVAPTPAPTPAITPSPSPTPTPTPTATPIPPLALTIHWPEQVSALHPATIQVELVPPPGVSVTATVRAAVIDPRGLPYRRLFPLLPRDGNLYAAEEPLDLALEPLEGNWQLSVYVHSALEVEGEHTVVFQPSPIPFRDLAGILPAGANMHVPQEFIETVFQGDQVAGGRAWRYGGGEVSLWWAPGPVEPLLLDNAVVMLETTYDPGAAPRVPGVEEIEFQGQTAFLFQEDWPGANGGPAEALVIQGPDYRLYVLRVRATGGEVIPSLLRQVWETFAFEEG